MTRADNEDHTITISALAQTTTAYGALQPFTALHKFGS